MGGVSITPARIRRSVLAGDFCKSHTQAKRDQLWHGGKRGVSSTKNPGCVLRYAGVPRDQIPHSIFKPCLVGPILGPQWEAGDLGRVVVELDFGS